LERKDSDRRGFFSKLVGLVALGSITSLLSGKWEKVRAEGENVIVGGEHDTATSTTRIKGNCGMESVIFGFNTYGQGGIGVAGNAAGTGGTGVSGVVSSDLSVGVSGWATSLSGSSIGVTGLSSSKDGTGILGGGGRFGIVGTAPTNTPSCIPIVAKGTSNQTANLQEWHNSAGTPLSVINKDGSMGIGTSSPARQLHIRGNQAVSRMDRDVDSAAFIFVRTAPGNFNKVWKSFMFGADASGVNDGRFVIGDLGTATSGVSTKRLVIDNTGRVGIGTETPTEKLHVAGNVKASGFITGDIEFANGVKATEEGKGLAFLNDAGEKIAILDRNGNFRVKGRITEDPAL